MGEFLLGKIEDQDMGCDIHCFVEYRAKGEKFWSSFGNGIQPGRNYEMFGHLAGVRYDVRPVVAPRGVPDDLGWSASDAYWLFAETEADSKRHDDWVKNGSSRYRILDGKENKSWVSHPDYHTHSWLTRREFQLALFRYVNANPDAKIPVNYEAIDKLLAHYEKRGMEARLVFWFDN